MLCVLRRVTDLEIAGSSTSAENAVSDIMFVFVMGLVLVLLHTVRIFTPLLMVFHDFRSPLSTLPHRMDNS